MENRIRKTTAAIILAAGSGKRMQCDKAKQNIDIFGETLLERSVRAFEECDSVDIIAVVARGEELEAVKAKLKPFKKVTKVVMGGGSRRESAKAGFEAVFGSCELVAVHDAARCLISPKKISKVIEAAAVYGAATAVSAVVDTMKLTEDGFIQKTLPRDKIFAAGTPQVFLSDLYKKAVENSEENVEVTDDNMMVEALGEKIFCVDVGNENIKVTTPSDLDFAKYIIEKRMKNG